MLLPQGVGVAARNGDIPAVRAWLDGSGDIDAFTKESPGFTLLFAAASSGRADVVSFLLDRGADATVGIRDDKFPLITAAMTFIIYRPSRDGPEMPFSTLTSQKEADLLRIVELLIAHGADVNAKGRLGETCFTVALILGGQVLSTNLRLRLVSRLMRAGASLDNIIHSLSAEEFMQREEIRHPGRAAADASFAAARALIVEVRAAGSYRKWLRAPHRDVIRLRSLLVRRRATTSDPVLAFVFRLGDNGVFWTLLGFWPGRVLPPGVRY